MQMTFPVKPLALATLALSALSAIVPAAQSATLFSQREVNQNSLVAVASPYGNGTAHQLLIIEQLSNARQCWSERAGSPTIVNPLLLNFDFTGICGRSIDSNGYSIRMAGQDLGLRYGLRVQRRGNDLVLVGVPFDRKSPELLIGHTNGLTADSAKFSFYPGWRLSKRVYNGQALGHIYLTNDQPVTTVIATAPTPPVIVRPTAPVGVTPKPPTRPAIPIAGPAVVAPKPPTRPAIPIAVPKPESSVSIGSPLPRPPITPRPPASGSIVLPQPRPNAGDFVVPTIEVNF